MKRLVFCFDGTWNRLDAPSPTNVVITAESVTPFADNIAQVIFYDEGVGTGEHETIRGGMFGSGLVKNLGDAYRFLIFNYTLGDEIYVFGFSKRGLFGQIIYWPAPGSEDTELGVLMELAMCKRSLIGVTHRRKYPPSW